MPDKVGAELWEIAAESERGVKERGKVISKLEKVAATPRKGQVVR